jgi:2-dehydropantoate 2-reductase
MGTLFAYQFAEFNDVTLVDVRGDVVDTINENGGVQLDDLPVRAVVATREPARAFATNFLFIFVKAPNTLGAIRPFTGKLNPATPIVSLQNGLGNEEAIIAALGSPVPLVMGATDVAALAVGHGRGPRPGAGHTVGGAAGASTATVRAVQQLIAAAHLECAIAYDIRPHLWGKLLANASINPIAALAESKNGIVTDDADARDLARSVALESAAVARGLRINLPFGDPWEYVRAVAAASAGDRNSMTIDLAAHLSTEIDQVNGAIANAGRRLGVPTPYNEALWRLVKAKQNAPRD